MQASISDYAIKCLNPYNIYPYSTMGKVDIPHVEVKVAVDLYIKNDPVRNVLKY